MSLLSDSREETCRSQSRESDFSWKMTAAGPVCHPTITSEGSLRARKSIIVTLLGACELADSVT